MRNEELLVPAGGEEPVRFLGQDGAGEDDLGVLLVVAAVPVQVGEAGAGLGNQRQLPSL